MLFLRTKSLHPLILRLDFKKLQKQAIPGQGSLATRSSHLLRAKLDFTSSTYRATHCFQGVVGHGLGDSLRLDGCLASRGYSIKPS
jgi:hypothetical protein